MHWNIERINENLYGVNMQYVRNGYISDIRIVSDKATGQVNLSADGRLLIDKSSKLYPALKKLFPPVMDMDTEKLKQIIQANQNRNLDALGDLYVNVCGWELKRREQKALYRRVRIKQFFLKIFGKG